MFWNNVKIALRNLRKHKLFATMNVLGLSIGLTIFVLGNLVVNYERTHDTFFSNSDRIYTVGTIAAPELDIAVDRLNSVYSAVGPIIEAELSDVEAVARTIVAEFLVTKDTDGYYQLIRFADPELLEIFDFSYIAGDERALDNASGVLLTESAAIRYFGETDVLGRTLTLDQQHEVQVAAVIENVPQNSHFNSLPIIEAPFEVVMPIQALSRLTGFEPEGDWNNLSLGNMTYVMLPESLDGLWLERQLNELYPRIVPEQQQETVAEFWVTPLTYANLAIWDTFGMPVISAVLLLSFLVLIVACVNYTNLATAQSFGRSREVGMRKTMGAGRGQLLLQFLVESLVITAIAMLVAVALLELIIPIVNNATNKVLAIDYLGTLPWLVLTVLVVGMLAGLYPAWLITRTSPIDALRDVARRGRKGSRVRSVMIGMQFAISAFMLAIVSVMYMQNEKVRSDSYEFPRSQIYVMQRLNPDDISERLDTLQNELEALPNVDSVAYSTQVPFEQNHTTVGVAATPGDEAGKVNIQRLGMTPDFLETYAIDLLAGRNLSRDVANDEETDDSASLNVLVNELALDTLGFDGPDAAINQRFYDLDADDALQEYVIVGVVPTQNITGLFNALKPWMYVYDRRNLRIGSVRITGGNMMSVIDRIEQTWDDVIPAYPLQGRFLDDVFDDVYNVLKTMNAALAGFAFIALSLALIGLFGLAAFMATQRTREIGVRKVLGANTAQIARLLVWQFSRPVLWALVIALPLAWLASRSYLNFFADRITMTIPILLVAGFVAVLLAWGTVAAHAIRIARANPVYALRYE